MLTKISTKNRWALWWALRWALRWALGGHWAGTVLDKSRGSFANPRINIERLFWISVIALSLTNQRLHYKAKNQH